MIKITHKLLDGNQYTERDGWHTNGHWALRDTQVTTAIRPDDTERDVEALLRNFSTSGYVPIEPTGVVFAIDGRDPCEIYSNPKRGTHIVIRQLYGDKIAKQYHAWGLTWEDPVFLTVGDTLSSLDDVVGIAMPMRPPEVTDAQVKALEAIKEIR